MQRVVLGANFSLICKLDLENSVKVNFLLMVAQLPKMFGCTTFGRDMLLKFFV